MTVKPVFVLLVLALSGCGGDKTTTDTDTDQVADADADADTDADADADADTDTDTDTDTGTVVAGCTVDPTGNTVGLLLCDERAEPGYTLFAPIEWNTTYLIDLDGELVRSWTSAYDGQHGYLLEDGSLMRLRLAADAGGTPFVNGPGVAGRIEQFSWDGDLLWDYVYASNTVASHHDFEVLPSGNVLMIAWELKTGAEAIAAGRDPAALPDGVVWADHLVEVDPSTDTIVWEWHVWDHLVQDFDPGRNNFGVVADHPELLDLNLGPDTADWNHLNAVDYNAELDQIVVSSPNQDEVWVIDHSTTTAEAAGHVGGTSGRGGDLLYRWGNASNYGVGNFVDRDLSGQHDVEWIAEGLPGAGNLLVFDNGAAFGASTVTEIETPVQADGSYPLTPGSAFDPAAPVWTWSDPTFFSVFLSSAQRLANGNTFVCDGMGGDFFELTPDGEIVWRYLNPVTPAGPVAQGTVLPPYSGLAFRADRYASDFPGFVGRDLDALGPLEQ